MWNSRFFSSSLSTWSSNINLKENLWRVWTLLFIRSPQKIFFHISTSVTIYMCFFKSFRLSKRIQKYSVMSCNFSQEWLDETINPKFSSCLKPLKDPNRVLCCFYQQSFALSNMGKRPLESHMKSDKYKRNMSTKAPSISSYIKKLTVLSKTSVPNSADTDTATQTSCATAMEINRISVASQMLTHYIRKDDVPKAEILLAL